MKLQAVLSPRRAFFLGLPARAARSSPIRVHRPAPAALPEAGQARMHPAGANEALAPEEVEFLRRLREAGL